MIGRICRRLTASLLFLALGACASVPGRLDPRSPVFPTLRFAPQQVVEQRLSGGARVFLLPDHDVPLVRVFLAFRGGAVYDPPEKAGLAQVASLAWRTGGTRSLSPEAFDEALESRAIEAGVSFGRDKGSASLSVLSSDLDQGLDLLAQLVMEPSFRQDRVAWAVGQVLEGIRREQDDPDSLAFRELRRHLYRGHPRGLLATQETAGRVTRDDVAGLHRRAVKEGAWVLGAVGNFESTRLLSSLERFFGRLPGDGSGFPPLPVPGRQEPRVILVPKPLPQSTILWARLGPERLSPDFYPLELADYALGSGGFQSRLVQEIRSNRGLAYSVGSFYEAYPEFGVLGAQAATKKDSTAEVLGLMRSLVERAGAEGFSPRELAAAKEAAENSYVFRYEDPAALVREEMGLALDGLPLDLPANYLPRLRAVTADDVRGASRRYFEPGVGVTVIVGDVDPGSEIWKGGPSVEIVHLP